MESVVTMDELLSIDAILDAFADAGHVLPRAALRQAADRWPEVGPHLLTLLEAAADGAEPSQRTDNILFYGIYLMAQMREPRAFQPLCRFGAAGADIGDILGDGLTEHFSLILARTFSGDLAPLRALIEAADADEFVRDAGFGALSWLTATGRVDHEETAAYLRALFDTMQPKAGNMAWDGWQEAIALLGLEDLAPLVERAFDLEWVPCYVTSFQHFKNDLRAARAASDPTGPFPRYVREDGALDDVAAMLSRWVSFRPAPEPGKRDSAVMPLNRMDSATPIRNPYRNVGRNDPCPCGSGKKFKKCCLVKAA